MKFNAFDPTTITSKFPPFEEGIYDGIITKHEWKTNSNGYPMLVVDLELFDEKKSLSRDWISFDESHFSKWKQKTFCESIGKPEICKSGNIEDKDLENSKIRAFFKESEYKDKEGKTKKTIKVEEYLAPLKNDFDDQISF